MNRIVIFLCLLASLGLSTSQEPSGSLLELPADPKGPGPKDVPQSGDPQPADPEGPENVPQPGAPQPGPQPGPPPGGSKRERCKRDSGLNFKLQQIIFSGEVLTGGNLGVEVSSSLLGNSGVALQDVASQIQCDLATLRDVLVEYIRGETPTAGEFSEVELLSKQVSVALSDLVWQNEDAIRALVGTTILGLRTEPEIVSAIGSYLLEYLGKSSEGLDFVIASALANGVSKEDIKANLAEVFVEVNTPDKEALEQLVRDAIPGTAVDPEQAWIFFQNLVSADILLKRGSVSKLQRLAAQVQADVREIINLFARIVATELEIEFEDALRLVELAFIIPGPRDPGDPQVSEADIVSSIVLDMATEDQSLIRALTRLTAGSFRREKTVEQALTGIISSFVKEERETSGVEQPNFGFGIFGTGLTLVETLRNIDVAKTLDNLILAENLRSEPNGDNAQAARDKAREDTANKDNLIGSMTSGTGKSRLSLFDFSESRQPGGSQGTDSTTLAAAFKFAQSRQEPGQIQLVNRPEPLQTGRESLSGAASGTAQKGPKLPDENEDRASDIQADVSDSLVLGNRLG